jgi:plasmid stabilization system protein ParE
MTTYWTDDALDHVTAIGEYLRLTSVSHSEATVNRFFDRVRQLEDKPYLGPIYPKANIQRVRHLLVGSYRVIYYIGRSQIDILAVMHQRQQ